MYVINRESQVPWFYDMTFNKKLAIVIVVVVVLSLYNIRTTDYYQVESLKDVIRESQGQFIVQLQHTKSEIEGLVVSLKDKCSLWDPNIPIVYGITPTYTRPVQKAELTRLSHTFKLVPNFHWIIIEDSDQKSSLVANLLKHSYLNFTHLAEPTPASWKRKLKEPKWKKPRGVSQRNAALKWLRENKHEEKGIVYFADDDNTYSLKVFQEMRSIKKVGVWPVGLVGGLLVEKPLLDTETGRIIGWNSQWRPERSFPVDMAGFAINLQYLLSHPSAEFTFNVERGFQESALLSQIITVDELEPKADNCTKVYVWHTRTEEPILTDEKRLRKRGMRSDDGIEEV